MLPDGCRDKENEKTYSISFLQYGNRPDRISHALELSKRGYNAFALIYRPEAQTACIKGILHPS